ncbi:RagB/SusD family nutrient uptake outer membrane protein [Sphingobacterium faecium]|uniref:RagB/SusD family nutrient uptake outer membrane protein n=1 Tax=Sphingobacterium faecium TaxID=34087 RepID=UPI003DA252E8
MKLYKIIILLCILLLLVQIGCKKDFLDQRPDLSKVMPKTLADCQALLDDYNRMNAGYSDHGEAASDSYYFTNTVYDGLRDANDSPEDKRNYSWHPQGEHVAQWLRGYQVVYNANLVLSTLEKIAPDESNYKVIKGSALFFRAFAYYHLAQLFCKPYTAATANTDLGIPLRMTPDVSEVSTRATVQQVYDRVTTDLKEAVSLLPSEVQVKSRPSKAAAYGALARTYLSMEDYLNAGKMAGECLKLQSTLIDYNATSFSATATTVRAGATGISFIRFNAEVIFQSVTISGTLTQARTLIHPDLYNSYSVNDRRKWVFFQSSGSNVIFRGNYDGTVNPSLFMGLATDELYLIRAECYARAGNTELAMQDLNTLLVKRMEPPYVNRTASSANNALIQILTERRKELIFRTLRWTDLRRLNKDPQFAITLRRDRNSIAETPLAPNDLRYTFLIPTKEVINLTGMPQNPR